MASAGLRERYRRCRQDIFAFCEAMRFDPTWQQRELLEAVQRGEKKIAVKSGQGPGKTTCSGIIGLWTGFRYSGTLGVVTAPTMRQCRDVWLAEVRRLMQRAEPWLQKIIKVTSTRVMYHGQRDWAIVVMTATNSEAAQGFHQKRLFVICEEASGIPTELITQFKGTLSNPDAFFLMIGNPNTRDCEFYKCFTSNRSKWHTLTFNAEETPRSSWFDPKRNAELEEEFGRNSDVYRVRVLGQFPHVDPNCVMSHEEVEACTDPALKIPCARASRIKQFGIDLARFGGDENVVWRRQGNAIVQGDFWPHTDPNDVVDVSWRWQADSFWRNEDCLYVVDAGGIGQGVMRRFYQTQKNVFEFHNNGKPLYSRKYANRITEAWFELAKRVKAKEVYLPKDRVLLEQLCNRQYGIDRNGLIKLESKEDYVKRGHQSPDRADALCMAFYDQGVQQPGAVTRIGASKAVGRSHRRR